MTGLQAKNNLSIAGVVGKFRNGIWINRPKNQFVTKSLSSLSSPTNTTEVKEVIPQVYDKKIEEYPHTQLTKLLINAGKEYGQIKGVINSSNIVDFSMWIINRTKPQWQHNGESGFYTPSAIKGLAQKIFGLTPTPGQLEE